MGARHKPRSGSLAFYPRKRAAKELATFSTVPLVRKAKPLNFVGYKAGMLSASAKNLQEKTTSFGQQIVVPATVIECPPLAVFGVRAYVKENGAQKAVGEVSAEKFDKFFRKKFPAFKKKSKKNREKKGDNFGTIEELEKNFPKISQVRLLCHTKPGALGFGKKAPDVFEVFLGGTPKEQFEYAMQKLGKEIAVDEVFEEKQFVDVKAVDKGKGFEGVVKRFGVKIHRRKAKKRRIVGSISPWNPSTVMRTVARPGQLGFQSRTELNKSLLKISSEPEFINVPGGFLGYGVVKNQFLLLAGSVPGPAKRGVALRMPIRRASPRGGFNLSELAILGQKKTKEGKGEEVRAQKMILKKEEKKEEKSVEDEIKEAVSGKGKK